MNKLKAISYKLKANKGFSTIELLVTVGIFSLITGIILVSFPQFTSKSILLNLSYEVALAIREAQVFGIAVREIEPGSGIFPSHGIHFDKQKKSEFTLFADINEDGKYGGDGSGEQIDIFVLGRGNEYGKPCGYSMATDNKCDKLNELYLTFVRPDPEATIIGTRKYRGDIIEEQYSYVKIPIISPRGDERTIIVWTSGQISVE